MSSTVRGEPAYAGEDLAVAAEQALADEDLERAVRLFTEAEPWVRDPDRCAGGRWMAEMLAGNFEAAWRESDAIRARGAPDPHRFWNGESLAGQRLMLRSLHGFGDAVQMFRFLPRLQSVAAELIVEVPPRLVELAPFFDGMGRVITWGKDAPLRTPAWDVQMEVMELPYVLRVTTHDLQPTSGYLRLPTEFQASIRSQLGPRTRPRVGLAWCAGEWNPTRSIPFTAFRNLLQCTNVEFWSLQGEPERTAWLAQKTTVTCNDSYVCGDGLLALANVIAEMDLVITVDTLAAHLAGALGVPCWLLLQPRADWRWMSRRTSSPWYPSLRLYRQDQLGEWGSVLQQVGEELSRWSKKQETVHSERDAKG